MRKGDRTAKWVRIEAFMLDVNDEQVGTAGTLEPNLRPGENRRGTLRYYEKSLPAGTHRIAWQVSPTY